jgi:hypothetical protein
MTAKNMTRLVARGLALYFFCWALSDVTYVPERVLALTNAMHEQSLLHNGAYWVHYHRTIIVGALIREVGLSLAGWCPNNALIGHHPLAAWAFWRCGPMIEDLLSPSRAVSDDET